MAEGVRIARDCGIVGAGGAGFPTHVKLQGKADTLLVNGAECEPLLYKDQEILDHHLENVMKGVDLAAEAVGASRKLVAVKEKHGDLLDSLSKKLRGRAEVVPLKDVYPSGDEFILVYEATRRMVPRAGIPLDVGVLVGNVETFYNLGVARPLTHKFVTVSGVLSEALTFQVPIGVSLREVLRAADAPTEGVGFIVGGPMMGSVETDLERPVSKTCAGILVLPSDHSLLARKARTAQSVQKIAASCDQCMRCSDLCPRDLLGHGVKPHKAMISVTMATAEASAWQQSALYCCECALCTLYACPEDLDPFRVMVQSKRALRAEGLRPEKREAEVAPMYPYRRTPTALLLRRLGLEEYIKPHRLVERPVEPRRLTLMLQQHLGAPATPVVRAGDLVKAGQLVAETPGSQTGSRIFTPLAGKVTRVGKDAVCVEVS